MTGKEGWKAEDCTAVRVEAFSISGKKAEGGALGWNAEDVNKA